MRPPRRQHEGTHGAESRCAGRLGMASCGAVRRFGPAASPATSTAAPRSCPSSLARPPPRPPAPAASACAPRPRYPDSPPSRPAPIAGHEQATGWRRRPAPRRAPALGRPIAARHRVCRGRTRGDVAQRAQTIAGTPTRACRARRASGVRDAPPPRVPPERAGSAPAPRHRFRRRSCSRESDVRVAASARRSSPSSTAHTPRALCATSRARATTHRSGSAPVNIACPGLGLAVTGATASYPRAAST